MNLAGNIANFRKDRGLTQAQLAEALNMTSAAVSKWETGAAVPDLDTLIALADYFRISLDELVGRAVQRVNIVLLCPDPAVEKAVRRVLQKYGYQLLGVAHAIEELEGIFARQREQGKQVHGLITANVIITDAVRTKIMDLNSKYGRYIQWFGNESVSEDKVEQWLVPLLED